MLNDWNIKSRSTVCQATGTSFEEGDFFYTLLFHDKEEYQRLDISEAAWEARKDFFRNSTSAANCGVAPVLAPSSTLSTFHSCVPSAPGISSAEGSLERSLKNDETQPIPFSLWRSKYELPPPPPPETLKKDDAEGMLRHFLVSNDPQHLKASYILALMLERKKILKPLESPDSSSLLYEHSKTGETFIITDPHLSLENLSSVQQEVVELLGGMTMKQTEEKNSQG